MIDNLSDDFYRLFNDMDQKAEEYEEIPVSSEELKRWRRNFRRNSQKSGSAVKITAAVACAAALVGLLAGPFNSYTTAAIENVSYSIHEVLGINDDISTYETLVGKSINKNGYTITLNSVVLDGNTLYATYVETHPKKIPWNLETEGVSNTRIIPWVVINGTNKCVGAGGEYLPVEGDECSKLAVMDMDFIKPIDTSKPVRIKFTFDVDDPELDDVFTIEGFEFVADASKIAMKTEEMPLDEEFPLPDGTTVHFTKYIKSPISRKIVFEHKGAKEGYDWELRIHDEMGNYVWNTSGSYSDGNGYVSYTTGNADTTASGAGKLICEMWGGYFTGAAGENVEGEYMEKIGEFEIPLD